MEKESSKKILTSKKEADDAQFQVNDSTPEEILSFKEWCKHEGRIEERTCRPTHEGKKLPNSEERKTITFKIPGYDEPVGKFTYFDHNPRNRSCEFGYVLNPKYRGKNLSAKMIGACIDHLFKDQGLNLNKLYCQTGSFNIPSVKTLEKLGMTRDAVLREHHELDGKFYDDYIYSILRSEWEKKQ